MRVREGQAAPTFKGSFGYHPLTALCDNTGESLAFRLRPGNAGSNTASDHIAVLDAAIAQLPDPYRRDLLITVRRRRRHPGPDQPRHRVEQRARAPRALLGRVRPDARARAAISALREADWQHVWDRDGTPRDLDGDHAAGVVELTGLLRTTHGGDELRTGRPTCGSSAAANARRPGRSCARWRRPTGGATSCSPPTPAGGSWTSSRPATAATPASRTASAAGRATGLDHLPSTTMAINQAWCVAATIAADLLCWLRLLCLGPAWPTPNPRRCATGCCTPPPGSSAANANAKSKSRIPGPGPTSWLPPSSRVRPARTDLTPTPPTVPTRGTPPASGTGAPDATVGHPHDPHPKRRSHNGGEDHQRRRERGTYPPRE